MIPAISETACAKLAGACQESTRIVVFSGPEQEVGLVRNGLGSVSLAQPSKGEPAHLRSGVWLGSAGTPHSVTETARIPSSAEMPLESAVTP